jgi:hypothetical protein
MIMEIVISRNSFLREKKGHGKEIAKEYHFSE